MPNQVVETLGGTWEATTYEVYDKTARGAKNGEGCRMQIRFRANKKVSSNDIALVQVLLARRLNGVNHDKTLFDQLQSGSPLFGAIKVKAMRTNGIGHLDRSLEANNPIYGAPNLPSGTDIERTPQGLSRSLVPGSPNKTYRLGRSGVMPHRAKLHDEPCNDGNASNGDFMSFETGAVSIKGSQKLVWYGSVRWGWKKENGTVSIDPLSVGGMAVPSKEFAELVRYWNAGLDKQDNPNIQLPFPDPDLWLPLVSANDFTARSTYQNAIRALKAGADVVTIANIDWTLRALASYR